MTDKQGDFREAVVYVQQVPGSSYREEDEIDLLELWNIVWGGKWFIIGFPLILTATVMVISFNFTVPKYKANATLEPVTRENNSPITNQEILFNYLASNKFHQRLMKQYDLLPKFYPELWNAERNEWQVKTDRDIPTIRNVLASKNGFPLKVTSKNDLIYLTWTGLGPKFCADMLDKVIKELRLYLSKEYESNAQVEMRILEEELTSLTHEISRVLEPFRSQSKSYGADLQIMKEYVRIKTRLSDLKAQDTLIRMFRIIDLPMEPPVPFEPNKKIPVLVFVSGMFVSVLLVFLHRFIRKTRQMQNEN